MTKIIFVDSDGTEKTVEAENGLSLLEVAHSNGIDLEGACEGSLACSTCHIIVEKEFFHLNYLESHQTPPDLLPKNVNL